VLVQPWIPSAWRKAVGIAGNASKEDVQRHVLARRDYPLHAEDPSLPTWPQDACDAYCIALATRTAITIEEAA